MLFVQAARVVLLRPANWPKHSFGRWLEAAAKRMHRTRADIHHGPEPKLHKQAGYISARPILAISESLLQRTAGPYIGS